MGEQRPAVVANQVEDDLLDRPPAEITVHLHPADDLARPRTQTLSRCWRKVLRDRDRASSSRRNGLKHSTIRSRVGMSRGTYAQLPGHLSRSDSSSAGDRRRPVALARWQASRQLPWVLLPCD